MFLCMMVVGCSLVTCGCCRVLLFFFFKQKTAYEMRISDWSSDVCSSDLVQSEIQDAAYEFEKQLESGEKIVVGVNKFQSVENEKPDLLKIDKIGRASCRERGVSTCRSRWSPYH